MVLNQIDLCESEWLDRAEKLCSRWTTWNASGFSSFLNHEGAWQTTKCGKADWNQELIEAAEDLLRPALDNLCDKSSNHLQESLTQTFSDLLDEMRSNIRGLLDTNQHVAFRDFFENMQKQGKDVEVTLKQACKTLTSDIQYVGSEGPFLSKSFPLLTQIQSTCL